MKSQLESEFAPHFEAWQANPGKATNANMLQVLDPVLDSAVNTFGQGEKSVLLKSRARQIAIGALPSYDPSRGKLRNHMMSHLQGLRRISSNLNQMISIPERVKLDQMRVRDVENQLRDSMGRDPTDSELADHSKISMKRLASIRGAHSGFSESSLADPETGESYQATSGQSQGLDSGWYMFVYHSLTPIDQAILEHTSGLHGKKELSNLDLAKKLRLTPSAVSQRKTKIQNILNQREELGVL